MATKSLAVFALTLGAAVVGCTPQPGPPDVNAVLESVVWRAKFSDKRLWLLSNAGRLSTIEEHGKERVDVPLPEPALDLWLQDGKPAVITCDPITCAEWNVRRFTGFEWSPESAISTEGDRLVAVGDNGTILVTSRRIVELGSDRQLLLSEPLPSWPVSSVYLTSESVFIGFHAGEWGGGLKRIDRGTGQVATVERNESGQLCGGPLNTECDPVNGIAQEPWNPGCIVIAIGLGPVYIVA